MKVGKLTLTQKNKINDKYLTDSLSFAPFIDINNNWVISIEEIESCTNEEFIWVKNLPLIDYLPI